jgi:glutamyl-Q tRNA(Asp) synthetase
MNDTGYRGRFAPSPTGPLHFGSLVAAVGSYLDARAQRGEWLVRIEDLDPPREVAGAADDILRTLERFGMYWDGDILYQSRRQRTYTETLERLAELGLTYPCACTRREIEQNNPAGNNAAIYPGTCRDGLPEGRQPRAIRLHVHQARIRFSDRLQGDIEEWLPEHVGDFVVRRADGLFAYQLAVVVDDAEQRISDVVRGADLLDSTCRQIYLQQSLGLTTPRYLHLPLAVNEQGEKLSKQTQAPAVDAGHAVTHLTAALRFLGQAVADDLETASVGEFWQYATAAWDPAMLPRTRMIEQR